MGETFIDTHLHRQSTPAITAGFWRQQNQPQISEHAHLYPVPLVRLENATCQSPSWARCWDKAGLPISQTCTLPQEGTQIFPGHAQILQPSRDPGIHLPMHSLHPQTSWMNCCMANGEKRPLRGRINLVLRCLPEKGQMNFAWTCLFSPC